MAAPIRTDLPTSCAACQFRAQSFFCELPKPALNDFEAIKHAGVYPAHSYLFMEGEAPRGIFVLCQGRVKLFMTSSLGKTLLLRPAVPGEILGLHAVISGRPNAVTAEVAVPTQAAFILQADFLRFLECHADACVRAMRQLSVRCHDAFEQMRIIGLAHTAAEKLARLLLERTSEGLATPQGIRIELGHTQEEIAHIIGSSRETVNRLFSRFGSEGLITVQGSALLVHDPAALASFINT